MADEDGSVAKLKVKKPMLVKAIKALIQLVAKRSANSNPLFGESSETMTVIFNLSSVPDKRRVRPVMIPLPHPMYDDKVEACFISKTPQKKYKELLLKTQQVPGVAKVIGVEKLRRNYKTVEAKRALADAYDLFLCDRNVVEIMPKILGSIFYQKKHKPPIPVRLTMSDPKPAIERAINGTPLRIPTGPSVGVKIGRCSMPEEHLVANAAIVIAHTVKYLARTTAVQSISVQATDSPALPVWRRPRPPGELLDMKKHMSDTASSAPSHSGASGASDSEGHEAASEIISDAGDTLSTRDTISEMDSAPGTPLSSMDTLSELDSEAGDLDDVAEVAKEDMPLFKGLKKGKKKRKGASASGAASPSLKSKASPSLKAKEAAPAKDAMPPPPPKKKAKKA